MFVPIDVIDGAVCGTVTATDAASLGEFGTLTLAFEGGDDDSEEGGDTHELVLAKGLNSATRGTRRVHTNLSFGYIAAPSFFRSLSFSLSCRFAKAIAAGYSSRTPSDGSAPRNCVSSRDAPYVTTSRH